MNRKGFTLIEMMIVVAIIAILVGIALPNMLGSRRIANEKAALGNLRTVATAMETYFIRQDQYPTSNPFQVLVNEDLLPDKFNSAGSTINFDSIHYSFVYQSGSNTEAYNITGTPTSTRFGSKCFAVTTGGETWQADYNGSCGTWQKL